MNKYPFKIAVCDDEPSDRKMIAEMTGEICEQEGIDSEIICFSSGKELLEEMTGGRDYDLLLLDVRMPLQNGMEVARQLRSWEIDTAIVFISNDREMALHGYEVAAARYLAKPLEWERLQEAILFCYGQYRNNREILIPANDCIRKVAPREICYIEISGRKSKVRMETEEWETSLSITELEEMLRGRGFVRCHQSFLVNCHFVRSFRTSMMELTDGSIIPVSKHRIKEVRKAFFAYMKE